MRHARRQVQDVAWFQHPFVGCREFLQQLEFGVGAEGARRIGRRINLPAAMTLYLQQEDVVLVHVRANRATRRGEADHDVVDAPGRQETKPVEQGANVAVPLVHVLHQQRPVLLSELREFAFGERPRAQLPLIELALVSDQAGKRGFLAGKASQVFRAERRLVAGEGLADEQGFLLPELAQEALHRHAQEIFSAGANLGDRHGQISRARASARPTYVAGVSAARRALASAGRSSEATNSRSAAWSMPWPRVSAFNCS